MSIDDTVLETLPGVTGDAPVDALVAGRYQIVRWLGAGGMGRVYEAVDSELGERVALKVLRAGLSEEALERFRREVRLTRRIQHRNVARMFDIGEHAGDRFLTMELVDGESLVSEIGKPMAWERLQKLAAQICAGLAAAHEAGVVHRDLKPDNILVERSTGRAVITDFGIARAGDETGLTQANIVMGTPRYMAPEQLAGEQVDARADVFSLGVMLFELASGQRPWLGDGPIAIAVAQATQPPRRLAHVPPSFAALVDACLVIERDRRTTTAQELGAAIAAIEERAPTAPQVAYVAPAVVESTLAVLSFASAPDEQYIADGVREDLIDMLSTTARLRVRPAGSHTTTDPRELGRELGVDHVVIGSVRRTSGGLRVAARLVSVADGFQVWAHRVDCSDAEILAVTDQLGQAIAKALSTRAASQTRPTDPRAVDLYLRARDQLRRFWGNHAQAAVDLLEQALAYAPDSPQIASHYAYSLVQAFIRQTKPELMPKVRNAVARALALDHPEAYIASAILNLTDGNPETTAAQLAIALKRAPMSALAHEQTGKLLSEIDPGPSARHHFETAFALDPSRVSIVGDLARCDALAGDRAGWERRLASLANDPDPAIRQIGALMEARLLLWHREFGPAIAAAERMGERLSGTALPMVQEARASAAGAPFDAQRWRDTISNVERFRSGMAGFQLTNRMQLVSLQRVAETVLAFDEREVGLEALEAASRLGLIDIAWMQGCPLLGILAGDPRFLAVRDIVAERASRILARFRDAVPSNDGRR